MRGLYRGMHGYRDSVRVLLAVFVLTIGVQIVRILAIWLCGVAVGVELVPASLLRARAAPLPGHDGALHVSTGSACARRSSSAFPARFGVDADAAFATGFLFYAVTIGDVRPGRRDHAVAERGAAPRPLVRRDGRAEGRGGAGGGRPAARGPGGPERRMTAPAGSQAAASPEPAVPDRLDRRRLLQTPCDVLALCLAAVADGPYEVIVVDNASIDGSPELVRELASRACG